MRTKMVTWILAAGAFLATTVLAVAATGVVDLECTVQPVRGGTMVLHCGDKAGKALMSPGAEMTVKKKPEGC